LPLKLAIRTYCVFGRTSANKLTVPQRTQIRITSSGQCRRLSTRAIAVFNVFTELSVVHIRTSWRTALLQQNRSAVHTTWKQHMRPSGNDASGSDFVLYDGEEDFGECLRVA
jgi:hypothetical protein